MPHDPILVADTQAWLSKAAADLRAAQVDMNANPPLLGDALFHCQQAAEKAMKSFLTWFDVPYRKTHDLVELGGECAKLDASLESLLKSVAPLTEYAWKFRYPGDPVDPNQTEAEEALALAKR